MTETQGDAGSASRSPSESPPGTSGTAPSDGAVEPPEMEVQLEQDKGPKLLPTTLGSSDMAAHAEESQGPVTEAPSLPLISNNLIREKLTCSQKA